MWPRGAPPTPPPPQLPLSFTKPRFYGFFGLDAAVMGFVLVFYGFFGLDAMFSRLMMKNLVFPYVLLVFRSL